MQQLRQYLWPAGDDIAAFQPGILAMQVGNNAACLLYDQRTGGDVPRFQVEFEKAIDPATGDVAQIQRCRAFAPCAGAFGQHIFQYGQIGVHHALVNHRKAGANQAFVHVDPLADADAAVVHKRTDATAGSKQIVAFRVIDHGLLDLAFVGQRDGNGVLRVAVQKIGGAVQRIDDPLVFGGVAGAGAGFFGQDGMFRVGFENGLDDGGFRGVVDFGNKIVGFFLFDADDIQIQRSALDQTGGTAGCLDRDVKHGVHEQTFILTASRHLRYAVTIEQFKERTRQLCRARDPHCTHSMNKPLLPNLLNQFRIVLARPSHPGNVGSAARAMKTMGLTRLYLVEPQAFPHEQATVLASGAADVLERAVVTATLEEALNGVTLACALTSRRRELTIELQTPRQIVPELLSRAAAGDEVALVFGNETFGLSIDEVSQCNRLVTIAGNPDYFSLNLAQAVQVLCYEICSQLDAPLDHLRADTVLATHDEVAGMLDHLQRAMAGIGYFERRNSERLMRRMQRLFARAALEREEIDILRGFYKQIERKTRNEDA